MTLTPKCEQVETSQGVALTVDAVAQVKVMAEVHMAELGDGGEAVPQSSRSEADAFLGKALEQFLGKTTREIESTILQTLEGHLRAILGTLTVEEIYRDRETFGQLVRETAGPDLAKMGLEILSFNIENVTDKVDYLDSLGRKQTADVKRDADIGIAHAQRDSRIVEAKCNQQKMEVRLEADSNIANARREFETRQAGFSQEINQKLAEAELAYTLQEAHLRQTIMAEQMEIEVIVRQRQVGIQADKKRSL